MSPRRFLPNDPVDDVMARRQIAGVLIWVAIWVCGSTGVVLTTLALAISRQDLVALGATMMAIGIVALIQRARARPRPLVVLVVASVGVALMAPVTGPFVQVTLLPVLTLFGFVGVLALPRRTAALFAAWCILVSVFVLEALLPAANTFELALATILVAGVYVAGWRLLSLATDLLVRGEEGHRLLLEGSPVAILEEDYSDVGSRLDSLRRDGVTDLETYLLQHRRELRDLVSSIKLRRANQRAVQMIGAESLDELIDGFGVDREDWELDTFIEQFVAIWEGRTELATDLDGKDLTGKGIEAVLHWLVPTVRGRADLGHVIVTLSDITPRKAVEERLSHLLAANRSMLEVEHALVLTSRALLLGSGEEALDSALGSLREASGSDIAYLTRNLEHPDHGLAFEVVRSAIRPGVRDDEWVGTIHPWSDYQEAADTLAKGEPFHQVATEEPGAGWNRSFLTVPVFAEGRWVANVSFVDIARQTIWDEQTMRMLEVAAPMLGTYWEREMTTRRLEELVRSKDRFVASVSHELRTPLAAILGFAEELRAHRTSFDAGELTEILDLIATQSQEMADMVEDLLVSARADIGRIAIRAQQVYLRAQAETVLASIGAVPHQDIHVAGGRGRVWADPARTRQIVRNLITNAIKYGGDTVVVEAVEEGSETTLTVIDNGDGLDPSQWETIFEPYQRAHETLTQPASIGLGLTVSRRLARMMGGDLSYRCDERGSVFSLVLPADPPEIEVSAVSEDGLLAAHPGN